MMVTIQSHNIISPLGWCSIENYEALLNGTSGISLHTNNDLSETPFQASLIDDSIIDNKIKDRNELKSFSRLEQLSILSMEDTLKGTECSSEKLGFIFSSTKGNIEFLSSETKEDEAGLAETAQKIAGFFGIRTQPVVISNACISGVAAFVVARRLIKQGLFDQVVILGADVLSKFIISGFQSFQSLSPNPCKPFDTNRDGLTLGEGVASILVEKNNSVDTAIEVVNGAISNDANHISGPSRTGEGLYRAITRTISENEKPDLICAHGTATPYNDDMESIAISRAGFNNIPVFGLKGYFGHTLGAAGVIESIISVIALANNQLIKTKGTINLGVVEPINLIQKESKSEINNVLKLMSGFGGCNAAVYFKKHG